MDNRFFTQKNIYQVASKAYFKWVFTAFILPLLFLQLGNSVIPTFFKTVDPKYLSPDVYNPTNPYYQLNTTSIVQSELYKQHVHNGYVLRILTTLVSALTAGWLAVQARLKWGETAEKYSQAAAVYNLLQSTAHYKSNECEAIIGNDVTDEELKLARTDLLEFMKYCEKLELSALEGVQPPPRFIINKIKRKIRRQFEDDVYFGKILNGISSDEEVDVELDNL